MILSIIVAATQQGVIGKKNTLLWRLPGDFKHFRETTTGHPIIMGRKTFESIGRSLPDRTNIVVTSNRKFVAPGVFILNSLEGAIKAAEAEGAQETFIIGGGRIYDQSIDKVSKIYLTLVHAQLEGDTFFKYDRDQWKEISKVANKADEKNPYDYDFLVLERK